MRNSERLSLAPDYAKAFGILLVVSSHIMRGLERSDLLVFDDAWQTADWALYLYHMPLFFYVAGLFFATTVARHGYLGMLKRNAVVLLGPMVVWSYVQVGIQYVFSGSSNLKVTLADLLTAPFPPAQQFWFLGVLFAATAIAGLLPALRASRAVQIGAFAVALAVRVSLDDWLRGAMEAGPYWFLVAQLIWHFPFLLLGMIAGNAEVDRGALHPLAWVAICAALLWGGSLLVGTHDDLLPLVSVLLVLASYKGFVELAARQPERPGWVSNLLVFVGANSMIIYLTHVIFGAGLRTILVKLGVFDVGVLFVSGVAAGMIFPLLLVPVGLAVERHAALLARIALPVRAGRRVA